MLQASIEKYEGRLSDQQNDIREYQKDIKELQDKITSLEGQLHILDDGTRPSPPEATTGSRLPWYKRFFK